MVAQLVCRGHGEEHCPFQLKAAGPPTGGRCPDHAPRSAASGRSDNRKMRRRPTTLLTLDIDSREELLGRIPSSDLRALSSCCKPHFNLIRHLLHARMMKTIREFPFEPPSKEVDGGVVFEDVKYSFLPIRVPNKQARTRTTAYFEDYQVRMSDRRYRVEHRITGGLTDETREEESDLLGKMIDSKQFNVCPMKVRVDTTDLCNLFPFLKLDPQTIEKELPRRVGGSVHFVNEVLMQGKTRRFRVQADSVVFGGDYLVNVEFDSPFGAVQARVSVSAHHSTRLLKTVVHGSTSIRLGADVSDPAYAAGKASLPSYVGFTRLEVRPRPLPPAFAMVGNASMSL